LRVVATEDVRALEEDPILKGDAGQQL